MLRSLIVPPMALFWGFNLEYGIAFFFLMFLAVLGFELRAS
jgi:hypothetical protein